MSVLTTFVESRSHFVQILCGSAFFRLFHAKLVSQVKMGQMILLRENFSFCEVT